MKFDDIDEFQSPRLSLLMHRKFNWFFHHGLTIFATCFAAISLTVYLLWSSQKSVRGHVYLHKIIQYRYYSDRDETITLNELRKDSFVKTGDIIYSRNNDSKFSEIHLVPGLVSLMRALIERGDLTKEFAIPQISIPPFKAHFDNLKIWLLEAAKTQDKPRIFDKIKELNEQLNLIQSQYEVWIQQNTIRADATGYIHFYQQLECQIRVKKNQLLFEIVPTSNKFRCVVSIPRNQRNIVVLGQEIQASFIFGTTNLNRQKIGILGQQFLDTIDNNETYDVILNDQIKNTLEYINIPEVGIKSAIKLDVYRK